MKDGDNYEARKAVDELLERLEAAGKEFNFSIPKAHSVGVYDGRFCVNFKQRYGEHGSKSKMVRWHTNGDIVFLNKEEGKLPVKETGLCLTEGVARLMIAFGWMTDVDNPHKKVDRRKES